MNKGKALRRIRSVFASYTRIHPADQSWLTKLKAGKLYELYCVAEVVETLKRDYGYTLTFVGKSIEFKMGPGKIHATDPHFDIANGTGSVIFKLYTDIEFMTLGMSLSGAVGISTYHELDIAVVDAQATGRPQHDQIALGVECKSHAIFVKSILKEVLGLRRELALLTGASRSMLSQMAPSNLLVDVPANPPSEYWLAFVAPNGRLYKHSPLAFGIAFKHWQP